jgi:hypothetical protein
MKVKMRQLSTVGEESRKSFKAIDQAAAQYGHQEPNRFEYSYSLKIFGSKEIVYEREPHRVIEIQDPVLYRGQMGKDGKTNQDSHKVFIVNGHIEKSDGNFNGGFYFNKVKDANIVIGTYPLSQNDILRIKQAGATAIINL